MVTDINALIDFFKKYTPQTESKDEIGEQDAAPASSAPSSGGGGGGIIPIIINPLNSFITKKLLLDLAYT